MMQHQRVCIGFLHDVYQRDGRTLTRVDTAQNTADIFTKALAPRALDVGSVLLVMYITLTFEFRL